MEDKRTSATEHTHTGYCNRQAVYASIKHPLYNRKQYKLVSLSALLLHWLLIKSWYMQLTT